MSKRTVFATLDPFFERGAAMGRKVANAGFLESLLAADPFDEYHFFTSSQIQQNAVEQSLVDGSAHILGRIRLFQRTDLPAQLKDADYYCFHQSDCIAFQPHVSVLRNKYSKRVFPVTGTTHSLSRAVYPEAFLAHLWPGVTKRDAIVCTSQPGLEVVEGFFKQLQQGYDLPEGNAPTLARIPLGVKCKDISPASPEAKSEAREALGIPDEQFVFLCFGRLEHHSKMDLLPLLHAVRRVHGKGIAKDRFRLAVGGWVRQDDDYPDTIVNLCRNIGLPVTLEKSPDEKRKQLLFHAADAFISIPDNPQETFGLTILEAGAYGLPVIASEYNGYKDLVVDGVTGQFVPTMGAAESSKLDAMARVLYDNQYHLLLAQSLAVDVPSLAEAMAEYILAPEKARTHGRAGHEHVQSGYSWENVVAEHLALWDRLWTHDIDEQHIRKARHPLHLEYSSIFGHYPTSVFNGNMDVCWSRTGQAVYREQDYPLIYAGIQNLVTMDRIKLTLFAARKTVNMGVLSEHLAQRCDIVHEDAQAIILWCLKHDLLELCW